MLIALLDNKILTRKEFATVKNSSLLWPARVTRCLKIKSPNCLKSSQICSQMIKVFFEVLLSNVKISTTNHVLKVVMPYFIKYNVHKSIVHIWISQWLLVEKIHIYFSRVISKEIIIASLFIIKAILKPFSATFHV